VAQGHPLSGQWNAPEPGAETAYKFDNYGNYEIFSRRTGTGQIGTYTTANAKLTLTPTKVHGSSYPDFCIAILMYTRSEMEYSMKRTDKGKEMTSEQITAFLNRVYGPVTLDYSIDGDALTIGGRGKYVKAQ